MGGDGGVEEGEGVGFCLTWSISTVTKAKGKAEIKTGGKGRKT